MIIDVIDLSDCSFQHVRPYLERAGHKHFVELCCMPGGLTELVRRIVTIAPLFSIRVLRVWGHGGAGAQFISSDKDDAANHGAAITVRERRTLANLSAYFAPNARVELRGCSVADDGGLLINMLAHLWNVRVQAARGRQEGLFEWIGVVEARPGYSGVFPAKTVPIESHD